MLDIIGLKCRFIFSTMSVFYIELSWWVQNEASATIQHYWLTVLEYESPFPILLLK